MRENGNELHTVLLAGNFPPQNGIQPVNRAAHVAADRRSTQGVQICGATKLSHLTVGILDHLVAPIVHHHHGLELRARVVENTLYTMH